MNRAARKNVKNHNNPNPITQKNNIIKPITILTKTRRKETLFKVKEFSQLFITHIWERENTHGQRHPRTRTKHTASFRGLYPHKRKHSLRVWPGAVSGRRSHRLNIETVGRSLSSTISQAPFYTRGKSGCPEHVHVVGIVLPGSCGCLFRFLLSVLSSFMCAVHLSAAVFGPASPSLLLISLRVSLISISRKKEAR